MAGKAPKRRRTTQRSVVLVALSIPVLLALYGALMYFTLPRTSGDEVSLRQFYDWAAVDEIDQAVLLNADDRVFFTRRGRDYWFALPDSQEYLNRFVGRALEPDNPIPLEIDQQVLKSLIQPATYIVPALIIVAAFLLFSLLIRGGRTSPFLKAAARRGATDRPVTFADVAGANDAVSEIREVRDYLVNPARFTALGAEAPRGILLVGPPGTGKTLLARAVAGEAGVPFFSMSGTDFVELYVGVGAARVRDLFRQVRERAPAILFIDELDAVGRARAGGSTAGADERDQTLNQLLVELDGFNRDTGVVLIGATNRPDILDSALLRPGRFDRQIVVDRPDRDGRLAILGIHTRGKPLAADVELAAIADQTPGFTGADLANVANEAALLAARRGHQVIAIAEFEEAIDRVVAGSEGRARLLTPDEKRAVACHEAGHAIVAWALPDAGPVTKISVMSRGRRLGFTRIRGEEERRVVSRTWLERRLAVLMGGQASEELLLGESTSAVGDDLRQATALARRMVCELGMSEALGRRALGRPGASFLGEVDHQPDYSGEAAALIDREIGRIVDDAFATATALLVTHRTVAERLASLLLERETLRDADLAPFAAAVGGHDRAAGSEAGAHRPQPALHPPA